MNVMLECLELWHKDSLEEWNRECFNLTFLSLPRIGLDIFHFSVGDAHERYEGEVEIYWILKGEYLCYVVM